MRDVTVVDEFTAGGRRVVVVRAPESPFRLYEPGDVLGIDGVPWTVTGREAQLTNPPKYVIRGHMGLSVARGG